MTWGILRSGVVPWVHSTGPRGIRSTRWSSSMTNAFRAGLDVVLDVYRAAQRLRPDAFAPYVLAWLGKHVECETAVMVTTFENYAGWVDAHLAGPVDARELMASHAKVRHLDVFSERMFTQPGIASRWSGGAPEVRAERYAPLREHLRRFRGWYVISIALPSAEHRTTTVVILCRPEEGREFSDAEVAAVQALAPHAVEASGVNRSIWLPRSAAGGAAGLPVALLDAEGQFVQTTPAFARLFWPNAPPSTAFLAEDALRALHKSQRWPLPGGKHTLYGEPEETGGFRLRIRTASALDTLTVRERQVATLFARGASYRAVAKKLGLAPATVRNHLQNLYGKLGVTQRSELLELVAKS
jgi:DNA-binding CsgD family transcriptional regulator